MRHTASNASAEGCPGSDVQSIPGRRANLDVERKSPLEDTRCKTTDVSRRSPGTADGEPYNRPLVAHLRSIVIASLELSSGTGSRRPHALPARLLDRVPPQIPLRERTTPMADTQEIAGSPAAAPPENWVIRAASH